MAGVAIAKPINPTVLAKRILKFFIFQNVKIHSVPGGR
jgi:hypothetical protein